MQPVWVFRFWVLQKQITAQVFQHSFIGSTVETVAVDLRLLCMGKQWTSSNCRRAPLTYCYPGRSSTADMAFPLFLRWGFILFSYRYLPYCFWSQNWGTRVISHNMTRLHSRFPTPLRTDALRENANLEGCGTLKNMDETQRRVWMKWKNVSFARAWHKRNIACTSWNLMVWMNGWLNEWMNEMKWNEMKWNEMNEWMNEWMNESFARDCHNGTFIKLHIMALDRMNGMNECSICPSFLPIQKMNLNVQCWVGWTKWREWVNYSPMIARFQSILHIQHDVWMCERHVNRNQSHAFIIYKSHAFVTWIACFEWSDWMKRLRVLTKWPHMQHMHGQWRSFDLGMNHNLLVFMIKILRFELVDSRLGIDLLIRSHWYLQLTPMITSDHAPRLCCSFRITRTSHLHESVYAHTICYGMFLFYYFFWRAIDFPYFVIPQFICTMQPIALVSLLCFIFVRYHQKTILVLHQGVTLGIRFFNA